MQRPVMNPMFMEEKEAASKKKKRFRFQWSWILVGGKFVGRLFFTNIFRINRARLRVEDGTPVQRFIRGLLYRLAFVPLVLVLFVVALVFAVTHPPHLPPDTDPLVQGVYYDPVTFLSEDGTRLEGWLVPVYDAKRVLEDRERHADQEVSRHRAGARLPGHPAADAPARSEAARRRGGHPRGGVLRVPAWGRGKRSG